MKRLRGWKPAPHRVPVVRAFGAVVLLMTLGAIGSTAASAPGSLTRSRADQIALKVLRPGRGVVVFRLPAPLAAGAIVIQSGPTTQDGAYTKTVGTGLNVVSVTTFPHSRIPRPAWLYWEDLRPGAGFQHPSELLLIDARSGSVVRLDHLTWIPLIDGRPPPFLATTDAYYGPRYRLFSGDRAAAAAASTTATSRVAAPLVRGDATPLVPPITGPPDLKSDCMITVGDRRPLDGLSGGFKLARMTARALHLDLAEASDAESLSRFIDYKTTEGGCKDVLIMILAHGFAPDNFSKNQEQGNESGHAGVQLEWSEHESDGVAVIKQQNLFAPQLRAMMNRHPRVGFKLIVAACFAGRWQELADVPNLRFIAMSSRADQVTYMVNPQAINSATGRYWKYDKGMQVHGKVIAVAGTLENHTSDPSGAPPFINGMLLGLNHWAQSADERAQTGNDLAKALVVAFSHEAEQDFQTQLGDLNPVVLDLSNRQPGAPLPEPVLEPIHAVFTPSTVPGCSPPACTTVYTENAAGTDLSYTWTVSIPVDAECAMGFHPNTPQLDQATWYHADVSEGGSCSHMNYDTYGYGHPGWVTVTVSNPSWICEAMFHGTQGPQAQPISDGPAPEPCTPKQ